MAIKVLDKSVYELIAAGEVIERPASVVKELIENSIDSGADKITIEIRHGGREYIRVSDNGCGIRREEIPTAFLRHATSKISTRDDLKSISTLGFRGEALASICAVSKVEVVTKRREDKTGTRYLNEGGESLECEDAGCPDGTAITVRELFFNVPARLKFLKKDVSEGNSIANMVSKIALSHPDISFKFIRDGRSEIVTSGDGKLISAVYAVMGAEFHSGLLPVEYTLNGVSVNGYVTNPLAARANRSFQNFFVNHRYVKSVTAMFALEEAFRNKIMTGKFPGCVIMIEIDPANTDVNVHPAKLEIRFSNEKPVYDAVYFAVKNALMVYDEPAKAADSIIKTSKLPLSAEEIYKPPEREAEQFAFNVNYAPGYAYNAEKPEKSSIIHSENPDFKACNNLQTDLSPKAPLYDEAEADLNSGDNEKNNEKTCYAVSDKLTDVQRSDMTEASVNSAAPQPDNMDADISDCGISSEPQKAELIYVGEIFKTYIIVQQGEDMYIIDKHAAHERYNFDHLKKGLCSVDSQNLLTPFEISLNFEGHTAVSDNKELLEKFGFMFDVLEPPKILLKGIPIILTDDDPADLLTEAADKLSNNGIKSVDAVFDELFHSVACKASIKANQFNSPDELMYLSRLVIDNEILYCPHGRPAIIKLTKYDLEKMFRRIV